MSAFEGLDPKVALNNFIQAHTKKSVTKTCITYATQQFGEQYQCTVKLNCLDGQEFAGEVSDNQKNAEKKAAAQALDHFKDTMAEMPSSGSKKKRKAETPMGGVEKWGNMEMAAQFAAFQAWLHSWGTGGMSPKMMLNSVCGKLAKERGGIAKGEVSYETANTPLGYQSTVTLTCLPGEVGQSVWAGEPAKSKKEAEQNAAKVALQSISPESASMFETGGKGAAEGWGMGKGMDMWAMMGKGKDTEMGMAKGKGTEEPKKPKKKPKEPKGPSGDDLPRERISQAPVTGEILYWMGKFGWIKPHVPIEHEKAGGKNKGKVFVSMKDVTGEQPPQGATVQFQVYVDASGLGAEEVISF